MAVVRSLKPLACGLALLAALAAFASTPFDYRKSAQNAASNLDVQQSLPEDSTLTDPAKSHPMDMSGGEVESSGYLPSLGAVWDHLKWVALALAVAGSLGFIASQIAESRRRAKPIPAAAAAEAPAAKDAPWSADRLLSEADACAAQGRYRDAVHYVLLAAMAHVASRFRDGAPESATSRELLRAAELQSQERTALRDLVSRADRAWFGFHPSGADDYAGARHCLETFLSGGGAA
jgi:hypothetical protein